MQSRGRLATHTWRVLEPAAGLDVRGMEVPLGDARLRELGEKLAARYPGYHDMGISPVAKVSYS